MLGHVLWREFAERFDAHATVRSDQLSEVAAQVLDASRTVTGVRAEDPASVERALDLSGAEVAVNCIGLVPQHPMAVDPVIVIRTNALFPHQLAAACEARRVRLIHVSTDCVFSGRRGGYDERDMPDSESLYGRSKLLGEPSGAGVLTLRTSMIGRELEGALGLLEWFLSQRGEVRGFTEAKFTGPTAPVVAEVIADLIELHPELEGTWHLGAEPITKHDLLLLLCDAFEVDIEITPDDSVKVDRTLDSSRFRSATGWAPQDWPDMVAALAGTSVERPEARRPVAGG